MWVQKEINLKPQKRGFHLITEEILLNLPEINKVKTGLLNIFLKHTSASLSLNENADPDVRVDMENFFSDLADNKKYYVHTSEGSDDMPAHIKASIIGNSLTIPITNGRLNLGIWQGIYLCEHRNNGGSRKIIITIHGE